jgi:hypothetical protein
LVNGSFLKTLFLEGNMRQAHWNSDVRTFVDQFCCVPGERDSDKPLLINDDGIVETNPDFISVSRAVKPRGTSIFLSFGLAVTIHRVGGVEACERIMELLRERYIQAFSDACGNEKPAPVVLDQIQSSLSMAVWPHARRGMDNGEVYLWMKEMLFTEDFAIALMRALWKSVRERPLMVMVPGASEIVSFYGIGFRFV